MMRPDAPCALLGLTHQAAAPPTYSSAPDMLGAPMRGAEGAPSLPLAKARATTPHGDLLLRRHGRRPLRAFGALAVETTLTSTAPAPSVRITVRLYALADGGAALSYAAERGDGATRRIHCDAAAASTPEDAAALISRFEPDALLDAPALDALIRPTLGASAPEDPSAEAGEAGARAAAALEDACAAWRRHAEDQAALRHALAQAFAQLFSPSAAPG